jgi:hypothetical protein
MFVQILAISGLLASEYTILRHCIFGYLPTIKMLILYSGYDSSASSSVEEADKLSKVKYLFNSFKCTVWYSISLTIPNIATGTKTSAIICRIFQVEHFYLLKIIAF